MSEEDEKDFTDKDLEPVEYNPDTESAWKPDSEESLQAYIDAGYEDEFGHVWTLGWEESENPHPGFGGSTDIFGGYVGQCGRCGMYQYEHMGPSKEYPGKYEGQHCGKIVR
jgi:hypothetical protein